MEKWTDIRLEVVNEVASIRSVQRKTGLHFNTVKKILANPSPPPFKCPGLPKPKLGPYLGRIADIISSDEDMPAQATASNQG